MLSHLAFGTQELRSHNIEVTLARDMAQTFWSLLVTIMKSPLGRGHGECSFPRDSSVTLSKALFCALRVSSLQEQRTHKFIITACKHMRMSVL